MLDVIILQRIKRDDINSCSNYNYNNLLILWFTEPGGSMLHLQIFPILS
jgi:hypothetical protein